MARIPSPHRPRPAPRARRRRRSVAALAGLLLCVAAVGAACGDDSASSTTVQRSSNQRPTTTESTTTESTTTTEPTTTSTTVPGAAPGAPTTAAAGGAPVAAERTDPTWTLNAVEFRGQDGRRIAVTCAPNGTFGTVWGSGPYTDDSSICTAAVHGGLITQATGGRVVVEIRPGEPTYLGTQANGVTTADYGSWSGSYVLVASS
jgi:hypothetical protein